MSQTRDKIRKDGHNMTNMTNKYASAPAPATKSTERWIASNYNRRLTAIETQVFDLYLIGSNIRVECGPTTFSIEVSEETVGTGKHEVIARVIDLTAGVSRNPRGLAAGAVQYQSSGWYIDLADFDQIAAVLQDSHNPASFKAVIRHLLKGDLEKVGMPAARRAFNNVRLKVLSARRRNDRDAIRNI